MRGRKEYGVAVLKNKSKFIIVNSITKGFRSNKIPESFAETFKSKLFPEFGCMPQTQSLISIPLCLAKKVECLLTLASFQ